LQKHPLHQAFCKFAGFFRLHRIKRTNATAKVGTRTKLATKLLPGRGAPKEAIPLILVLRKKKKDGEDMTKVMETAMAAIA
jgi:hypothetical protein